MYLSIYGCIIISLNVSHNGNIVKQKNVINFTEIIEPKHCKQNHLHSSALDKELIRFCKVVLLFLLHPFQYLKYFIILIGSVSPQYPFFYKIMKTMFKLKTFAVNFSPLVRPCIKSAEYNVTNCWVLEDAMFLEFISYRRFNKN